MAAAVVPYPDVAHNERDISHELQTCEEPIVGCIVQMTNDHRFVPHRVTVMQGEAVLWQNISDSSHTVTAELVPSKAEKVNMLSENINFDSGIIEPGREFRFVFTKLGTYRYFSKQDRESAMTGEVIVMHP
jgi:plastocyanin